MKNQYFNFKDAFAGMFLVILIIGSIGLLFYLGLTYIPIEDISLRFGLTLLMTLTMLGFIIGGLGLDDK